MDELVSRFTRQDIETLLEAMGDWETMGNQEYHFLQLIKSAPMPPQDHEAYEAFKSIKKHFKRREEQIKFEREVRKENATLLNAKLIMTKRKVSVNELFDMAANVDLNSPPPKPKPPLAEVDDDDDDEVLKNSVVQSNTISSDLLTGINDEFKKKLEKAEFFIRDLGVWAHYEKFLKTHEEDKKSFDEPDNCGD